MLFAQNKLIGFALGVRSLSPSSLGVWVVLWNNELGETP